MAGESITSEELVDPDYGEAVVTPLKTVELTGEQKAEKISAVIQREFSAEIQRKEKNIEIIDERLLLAKKTLHRLRYAIVNSYYNSKEFELTKDDIQKEVTSQKDPVARNKVHNLLKNEQKRIHPALKKLLGTKTDLDLDELFKIRPPRKRNKLDAASIPSTSQHLTIPVDDNLETLRPELKAERSSSHDGHSKTDSPSTSSRVGEATVEEAVKVPRYIEPKGMDKGVLKMDLARRNKQKEKFRVIIGNTSKYTPPHSEMDRSTHRWLLYVRGPRDRPDVSHIISSVTVGLDQSYAPHNVIHLKSSPFHLSRRGWGEFPVQIRLHFKNDRLNKSVNLVHQLRLDRNYTGLQTLGAETVVDVWLYTDESMVEKSQVVPKEPPTVEKGAYISEVDQMLDEHNTIPQDGDLLKEKCWLEFEKKVNSSHSGWSESDGFDISKVKIEQDILEVNETRVEDGENVSVKLENEDYLEDLSKIKSEPTEVDYISDNLKRQRTCDILDIKLTTNVPQVDNEHRKMTHASRSILKTENNVLLKQQKRKSLLKLNNQISLLKPPEVSVKQFSCLTDIGTKQSHVDAILRDHCYVQEKYLSQSSKVGANYILSYPNQSNRQIFVKLEKEDKEESYGNTFAKSPHTRVILGMDHDSGRAVKLAEDSERAVNAATSIAGFIKASLPKLECVRAVVDFLLRRMPLVHEMAGFAEFQKVFPFAVESEERYYELGTTKRRNKEWTRAKIISNIVKKHFEKNSSSTISQNRIWTTKQIILYSHYHGYIPVNPDKKNCETELPKNSAYNIGCFDSGDFGNSKAYKKKIELKELFENTSIINTLSSMREYSKNIIKAIEIKKEPDSNVEFENDAVSNVKLENTWSHFLYDSEASCSKQTKTFNLLDSSDDEIDICSTKEKKVKKVSGSCSAAVSNRRDECVLPFEDEDEKLRCFFIEKLCAEQGIELRNEQVGNGYSHSLAHKVILSAVRSLVEDILRRSLAVKMAAADARSSDERAQPKVKRNIWRTESGEVHSVSLRHVFEAIGSREELDILTNAGLGTEQLEYSEKL